MARQKEKESRDSAEQQTQPASLSIDKNLESLGIAPVRWVDHCRHHRHRHHQHRHRHHPHSFYHHDQVSRVVEQLETREAEMEVGGGRGGLPGGEEREPEEHQSKRKTKPLSMVRQYNVNGVFRPQT